jgi:Tol biopolymer transport system component
MKSHCPGLFLIFIFLIPACSPKINPPITKTSPLPGQVTSSPSVPSITPQPQSTISIPSLPTNTPATNSFSLPFPGLVFSISSNNITKHYIISSKMESILLSNDYVLCEDRVQHIAIMKINNNYRWLDLVDGQLTDIPDFSIQSDDPRCADVKLSPDKQDLYYIFEKDLWVFHISSGISDRLTHTPDRWEHLVSGIGTTKGFLAFLSDSSPAIVNPDGTEFTLLTTSPGEFDVSPDGRKISFYQHPEGKLFIYSKQDGIQPLLPTTLGLSGWDEVFLQYPSWSPDGEKLAMSITLFKDGASYSRLAIIDINQKSTLFYSPSQGGFRYSPDDFQWSPDGLMVGFFDREVSDTQNGIWIANANTGELNLFVNYPSSIVLSSWIWSPDSHWIAFSDLGMDPTQSVWIKNVKSGEIFPSNLPEDVNNFIDWLPSIDNWPKK